MTSTAVLAPFHGGDDVMHSFDLVGAESLGFDMTDVAKMTGGFLSTAGSFMQPGKDGGKDSKDVKKDVLVEIEQKRLKEEKQKAEQSANNMKIALGVVGATAFMTTIMVLLTRKLS